MSNKPNYETTEIEEIPKEWELVRLDEVLKHEDSGIWGDEDKENGTPVLRSTNFREDGYISYDSVTYRRISDKVLQNKVLKSGDILLERSGGGPDQPVGRVAFFNKKDGIYTFGNFIQRLIPNEEKIDSFFLFNLLHFTHLTGYTKRLQQQTTGIRNLDYESYLRTKLLLPPLPEQSKIAEILSAVDEAIRHTSEIIAKTRELRKGLMQQLLTKGIGHTKFKQTEIGEIPVEWELEDCTNLCNEITVGIVVTPAKYYEDSGVPCLRSLNVLENQINSNDLVYISVKANELHKKSILRAGDVVVVRSGYPGTAAVVSEPFDGCNCIDLIIARPNERIDPQFLTRFINSQAAKRQIFSWRGGSAQQHFNVGVMKKLRILVPSKQEQKQIVEILSACEEKIEKERQRKEQLEKLKKGLMQDLLTGRVRVKVG